MNKKGSKLKLLGANKAVSMIGVQETVKSEGSVFEETIFDVEGFNEQLGNFIKEDHSSFVEGVNLKSANYIIKVFAYKDPKKSKVSLLDYGVDGKVTTISKMSDSFKITHVAKVLSVGKSLKDPEYKIGDIVLLPQQEVTGQDLNPIYVQALQYSRSFGGEQPIIPKNCPEKVPSIQAHWRQYMFTKPQDFNKSVHEIFEFCVPEHKIVMAHEG